MKHIKKKLAPRDYIEWCKANKGKPNEDYRCLQNPEKGSLHEALVNEQGGLCGYTMRHIDADSSHIEHIKPEALCRSELRGSDLDYQNLIACYPKEGMINPFRYGAQAKDKWWDENGKHFVSPLNPNCESKFIFNMKGEISAVNNNSSALTTIKVLKLDHPSLTEDRKRAIIEFILGTGGSNPLPPKHARRALEGIFNLDKKGRFTQFCVAIRDALIEYINNEEKKALKRQYAQNQKNKQK